MQLDILVVSYKRPRVLDYTLQNLIKQIKPSQVFDSVRIFIALNECTQEDCEVVDKYINGDGVNPPLFPEYISDSAALMYKTNQGKAQALNDMYDIHNCKDSDYVLQIDGDMVFTQPFMPHLEAATKLKFDIVGFAGTKYWGHIPARDKCTVIPWQGYNIYYTSFIAGGIMMFHSEFLNVHKWTNEDGIYGGDDYNMCFETDSKFILEHDSDWIRHDPIGNTLPELKRYYGVQKEYREAGIGVLPKGWYEDGYKEQ